MYFDFLRYFYTITYGFHCLTGFFGAALLITGSSCLICYINNAIDDDYLKWYWLTFIIGVALLTICALTPFEDGVLYLIGKH